MNITMKVGRVEGRGDEVSGKVSHVVMITIIFQGNYLAFHPGSRNRQLVEAR